MFLKSLYDNTFDGYMELNVSSMRPNMASVILFDRCSQMLLCKIGMYFDPPPSTKSLLTFGVATLAALILSDATQSSMHIL